MMFYFDFDPFFSLILQILSMFSQNCGHLIQLKHREKKSKNDKMNKNNQNLSKSLDYLSGKKG